MDNSTVPLSSSPIAWLEQIQLSRTTLLRIRRIYLLLCLMYQALFCVCIRSFCCTDRKVSSRQFDASNRKGHAGLCVPHLPVVLIQHMSGTAKRKENKKLKSNAKKGAQMPETANEPNVEGRCSSWGVRYEVPFHARRAVLLCCLPRPGDYPKAVKAQPG